MSVATVESLGIPETFNAAAHFVDRHVATGRGAHVAIECGDARVTYDDVLRNVNRAGNALRRLGVRPEERVLLLLLDGRSSSTASSARSRSAPCRSAEHAVESGRLSARDRRFARVECSW
jgi:non-ribosomal peptide synthetase component F